MRVKTLGVLLLLPLLSGCFGGGGDDGDDDGTGTQTSTETGNGTAQAPILLLNVTIGNDTYRFTSQDLATRPPPASSTSGTVTVSSTNTTTSAGNTTTAGGNATGNATGNGTQTPTGPAPLNVTFELGARRLGNASDLRWTLADAPSEGRPGNASAAAPDGNGTANATAGTELPAVVERTYNATGTYQVTYALRLGNGSVERLDITLVVSNGTGNVSAAKPLPEVTHFEFGPSLGCTADTPAGMACISFEEGPGNGGIDGYWVELGEPYWGLTFTSTVQNQRGDSDAVLVDADGAIMDVDVNGGGTGATGLIVDGAAWLFIYSYAEPHLGITVDFALTPA